MQLVEPQTSSLAADPVFNRLGPADGQAQDCPQRACFCLHGRPSVVPRRFIGVLLIALNDGLYEQLDPSILLPACGGAIAGAWLGFSPALDADA